MSACCGRLAIVKIKAEQAQGPAAWKSGKRTGDCTPSIKELGLDSKRNMVMELSLPERDEVYVDVMNKKGEVIWRLIANDLEPGVHQVVWDGFDQPGIYSFYVRGMGWDAEKQMVIYS